MTWGLATVNSSCKGWTQYSQNGGHTCLCNPGSNTRGAETSNGGTPGKVLSPSAGTQEVGRAVGAGCVEAPWRSPLEVCPLVERQNSGPHDLCHLTSC